MGSLSGRAGRADGEACCEGLWWDEEGQVHVSGREDSTPDLVKAELRIMGMIIDIKMAEIFS